LKGARTRPCGAPSGARRGGATGAKKLFRARRCSAREAGGHSAGSPRPPRPCPSVHTARVCALRLHRPRRSAAGDSAAGAARVAPGNQPAAAATGRPASRPRRACRPVAHGAPGRRLDARRRRTTAPCHHLSALTCGLRTMTPYRGRARGRPLAAFSHTALLAGTLGRLRHASKVAHPPSAGCVYFCPRCDEPALAPPPSKSRRHCRATGAGATRNLVIRRSICPRVCPRIPPRAIRRETLMRRIICHRPDRARVLHFARLCGTARAADVNGSMRAPPLGNWPTGPHWLAAEPGRAAGGRRRHWPAKYWPAKYWPANVLRQH
jgi:hypothetical protein